MKVLRSALLALVVVALTLGLLWRHYHTPPPQEATWEEVRAEAQSGGYRLITTEELANLYSQAPQGLLLVDTRTDWEYCTGHIQGAVNFPLEPTRWGRWRAEKALAALLGPDQERPIVFY